MEQGFCARGARRPAKGSAESWPNRRLNYMPGVLGTRNTTPMPQNQEGVTECIVWPASTSSCALPPSGSARPASKAQFADASRVTEDSR